MKKHILASLLALAAVFTASAQMRTSYFMEGSTFRTDLNPALAPTRGYINIPVISQFNLNLNNNFLAVDTFLYKSKDADGNTMYKTFLHPDIRDTFLKNLANKNTLAFNTTLNVLGFGGHAKKFFWAFGLNVKADADITIPKSVFSLLTNIQNGVFDMSGAHVGGNAYGEIFLGAAIPITDWATFGFRVKGLVGLVNLDATVDNMYVDINEDIVEARMNASIRGGSVIPFNAKAGQTVNSFQDLVPDFSNAFSDIGSLLRNIKSGGAALDLGAEVRLLNDHLRLSAAITDLGFICWHKNTSLSASGSAYYAYKGFDLTTDSADIIIEQEDPEFAIGDAKSYNKRLNTSLNFGVEYAILRNHISFGVLSHTQFGGYATTSEITASVNLKPVNWITLTASHTFLCHNKLGVMGLAFNLHPSVINLFVGADFIGYNLMNIGNALNSDSKILVPVSMKSMNVYAGFGFSLGRGKYTKSYKEDMARKAERKEARQAKRAEKKASK